MASAGPLRMVVADYLKEMSVPAKYADLIFAVSNDRLRFIDENEFAKDFAGYISEFRSGLEAKCGYLTGIEKTVENAIGGKEKRGGWLTPNEERMNRMLAEKQVRQGECVAQESSHLREDAWKQLFAEHRKL
jgi:hypothetical protein